MRERYRRVHIKIRKIKSLESNEKETSLQRELCLSAMAFSSSEKIHEENSELIETIQDITLEQVMEKEGLRYFGGFITKKFPQCQSLRKERSR